MNTDYWDLKKKLNKFLSVYIGENLWQKRLLDGK